jgi:hypothetical protein
VRSSRTTQESTLSSEKKKNRREDYQRPAIFGVDIPGGPRRIITEQEDRKKRAKGDWSATNKTPANTMFSSQQWKDASAISAKQVHVEDQKQVQRDFSTDHGVFRKFWELVSCHKYKGSSGYGLQIADFMPPSPKFVDNEKEYNRWKEMATKLGSAAQLAAQRAEYKKKLFEDEEFPASPSHCCFHFHHRHHLLLCQERCPRRPRRESRQSGPLP